MNVAVCPKYKILPKLYLIMEIYLQIKEIIDLIKF